LEKTTLVGGREVNIFAYDGEEVSLLTLHSNRIIVLIIVVLENLPQFHQ